MSRLIQLPSGKVIEVQEVADAMRSHTRRDDPPHGLHVCPYCESELVYPTSWDLTGTAEAPEFDVTLRCPDCEWWDTLTVDQADADLFDDALEDGCIALTRAYRRLCAHNQSEWTERFGYALTHDGIRPEDF